MDPAEVRLANVEQLVSFLTAKVTALERRLDEAEDTAGVDFFNDGETPDPFRDFLGELDVD